MQIEYKTNAISLSSCLQNKNNNSAAVAVMNQYIQCYHNLTRSIINMLSIHQTSMALDIANIEFSTLQLQLGTTRLRTRGLCAGTGGGGGGFVSRKKGCKKYGRRKERRENK